MTNVSGRCPACLLYTSIGMKETEVSALLQYLAIKNGASAMAFDTIVASGVRGSMPHGRPSEKTFEAHEFITIDFGITYQGYQSDMTRTVCIQEPKPELKKIYDIVLEAQCAGVDFIKAGIRGNDVDSYVRGIIQGHGYGPYFTHGLGPVSYTHLDVYKRQVLQPGAFLQTAAGIDQNHQQ